MAESASSELTARAKQREGTTLGDKYTIEKLLGVGGMAAVYAARHRNKKRCAIKVLHPELSVHREVRDRFLREGYVANTIEHDGAVKVDDDDTTPDGSAYLVMELLEGETVEALLLRRGGRLDQKTVMTLTDQVLDILTAAHEKGIVHRDIKPDNLFLHRGTTVKLLDFGIARLRESDAEHDAKKTVDGAVMGTPAFMPPEQARGLWDEVDAQSDLWSVGATMYALLTGEVVHKGATLNEALAASITQPARPVRDLSPDVHPRLAEVVDTALQREKSDRFRDATAMRSMLRQAHLEAEGAELRISAAAWSDVGLSQQGVLGQHESYPNPTRSSAASYGDITGTSPPVTATHATHHERSKLPMIIGIGAALAGVAVLVAGGIGYFVYQQKQAEPGAAIQQPASLAPKEQLGVAADAAQKDAKTAENPSLIVAPAEQTSDSPEASKPDEDEDEAKAKPKMITPQKTVRRPAPPKTARAPRPKPAVKAPGPAAAPAPAAEEPPKKPAPKKDFDPFAQRD